MSKIKDDLNSLANGSHKHHPDHGKVVSTGFGGSRWYEYKDGTVKTYLNLLKEKQK